MGVLTPIAPPYHVYVVNVNTGEKLSDHGEFFIKDKADRVARKESRTYGDRDIVAVLEWDDNRLKGLPVTKRVLYQRGRLYKP